MSRSPRARLAIKLVVVVGCVASAAIGPPALAASAVHYEHEELAAYEAQLHHGEVHAVAFHPGTGTGHIHVSLNDGRHMTVLYSDSEQAHLVALGHAAHAPVVIAAAKANATSKPVHHKLRYIAGGIVIVVIVVVAAVLLIDRRRKLGEAGPGGARDGGAGAGAPAPPSPGDPT
jgi:hypothetical protein